MVTTMAAVVALTAQTARVRTLARDGKATTPIVVSTQATPAERHAAEELAVFLKEITGAEFGQTTAPPKGPAIYVGPGEHLRRVGVTEDPASWGPDELVIRTVGRDLVLAGGRPRGTLYAVYTFLEDVVGCRWWSSTASTIPRRPTLTVPDLDRRERPAFEYREPFYWDAFDPDWAVRNKANGNRARLDEKRGGHITYQGFVHTFNRFVPPATYFKSHPEWFSELGGTRSAKRSQLCLTNDELKRFMAQQVLAALKKNPKANIVSVSQNDWRNPCQCKACAALAAAEGSESGPVLHFVNAVAEEVEKEFPHVAISTLAYQYTRKPPRHVRPRHNVIVRLCSIECNFAEPLGTGPTNVRFRKDIEGWANVAKRLYVWDYVTNFAHYIQPHPNLRVLGPNVRFFAANHVKGLFEQGNYQSPGGEFAELRAWVLAKLLWNPKLDDRKLITQFLAGYYGPAAPHILAYIDLLHDAVEKTRHYLTIGSSPSAPFLSLETVVKAHALFDAAEQAAADQPDVLQRVKVARLPVQYVSIRRWRLLRAEARVRKTSWLEGADVATVSRGFFDVAKAIKVTRIREGAPLSAFAAQTIELPRREPTPPAICEKLAPRAWVDLQDDFFNLYRPGTCSALKKDQRASDGAAAWMPSTHIEWAVQCRTAYAGVGGLPGTAYRAYVVVRCETTGKEGGAFTFGAYDVANRKSVASGGVRVADVADADYHTYQLGTFPIHSAMYLWVAPTNNPKNVKGIWVDRFFLIGPVDAKK